MLTTTAKVIAIHAQGVEVCARSSAGCERCAQGQGCGGGLIGALLDKGETRLLARSGASTIQVGDWVALHLSSGALLKAAAVAYLIPLASMVVFVLGSFAMGMRNDLWLALTAAVGLAIGRTVAGRYMDRTGIDKLTPTAMPTTPDNGYH